MKTISAVRLMIFAACMGVSCTNAELTGENESSEQSSEKYRLISFSSLHMEVSEGSPMGIADWSRKQSTISRSQSLLELATTLSYWDYMDDELQQSDTIETSSPLEMQLRYGSHHIYFLAHSSTSGSSSPKAFTFTPEKVTETFWTDFPLEVNSETAASQTIGLSRVVSKAKITVKDAIPAGVRGMRMTVGSHYRTLDLKSGNATAEPLPYSLSWNLGTEYEGRTGLFFYIFTFTPTADEEFNTTLKIEALSEGGEVLFTREASSIPLLRNRCTNASCRLFSGNAGISFSDPEEWEPDLEIEI